MSFEMIPQDGLLLVFTLKGAHEQFDAMVEAARAEMAAAQAAEPARTLEQMHDFVASNGVKVGVIARGAAK